MTAQQGPNHSYFLPRLGANAIVGPDFVLPNISFLNYGDSNLYAKQRQ